jgi:hypothetical protein
MTNSQNLEETLRILRIGRQEAIGGRGDMTR